ATGLMGHTRGLGRIVSLEDLPMDTLHHPLEIFAQTTMDPEAYEAFLHRILQERDRLRAPSAELHIHRTICGFVANRKESLTRFASSVDLLLFLTGKESSNGKYLFSLALKANAAAHALGGPDELQPEWFRGVRRLGISGATSTPVWQMEELARVIREHYASIEF
ncbi:MAG TPA: 4-hydroxy-3-methylbut-2-enyl diphosphate reductase, partial [Bacteroidales bacterium]|nr:4-hydroxy-3-methylbut-2-enyl diphosphate reductase [Bacteroidales bacterium]